MDLSGNRIGKFGLKVLMKLGLLENESVICFDARLNPGFTPKLKKQFALCMLKNIDKLRNKGLNINKEWLVPELYSFEIKPSILKSLGLKSPDKTKQGNKSTLSRGASSKRTTELAITPDTICNEYDELASI